MARSDTDRYEVLIVGARVAGAATALLLARAGHRVLVVDRARRGSDTLSTHALMRPAVHQLRRWGLLDRLVEQGTPPQQRVVFHYGDDQVPVEVAEPLYAPRRTVLDPLLVAAAEEAGAEFRFGVSVEGVLRDGDGQVAGVRLRDERRRQVDLPARVTVGADGRRSRVAREVDAPVTHRGTTASAFLLGYWSGVEAVGYEWCYRPGSAAGVIPTNDGQVCVFAGVPSGQLVDALEDGAEVGMQRILMATTPAVAERIAAGQRQGPVRCYPGMAGWLRRPWGPGWALVGDAGYFKDPLTAHGMTDALRDAELVALAVHRTLEDPGAEAEAGADYQAVRDRLSLRFFEVTNAIAGFGWDLSEVQSLHLAMSEAMKHEYAVMAASEGLLPHAAPTA
ncbi:MAG: NAD(P)/FAD-dependent oxidoreductase [Nitriliruptoraceae bacterium]